MDDGQHEAAWQRIEAALNRLDAAACAQGERPALAAALQAEQARHEALRGALRETLGRIDALITTHSVKADQTP